MLLSVVTPDPASVVAGWIPLALMAVLIAAMVVLYRSLRKQLHKIDIPEEGISTRRKAPAKKAMQPQHAERG